MSHVWIVERRFKGSSNTWSPMPSTYSRPESIEVYHRTRSEARGAVFNLRHNSPFLNAVEFRAAKYVRED